MPVHGEAEFGRNVLTDVDVLSIDVDFRLRVTVGLHECKSGEGQSKEPDRLLWLAGFRRYLRADRATLVRQTTTRRGQAMARQLGLTILDVPTLERREAAQAWLPHRFAHVGGAGCAALETRTDTQLKGLRDISAELVRMLRHEALSAAPYDVVSALLALSAAVERQGVLPSPTGEILASHALVSLFAAALRDAGHLDSVPMDELRKRLSLALTVGSPTDTHILSVLDQADALMRDVVEGIHRAYAGLGVSRIDADLPSLRAIVTDVPERAIDHYLDLVERLRANPSIGRDMLQTTELACFDALPGDKAWTEPAFDHLFSPEHRQLLMTGVRVLTEICGTAVGDRLRELEKIPFERVAPALPDRRSPRESPSES